MIGAVYFGYGGVLSPGRPVDDFRKIPSAYFDPAPDPKSQRYLEPEFFHFLNWQLEDAAITTADYFDELSMRFNPFGHPYAEEEYVSQSPSFRRHERVYDLAAKLRENGITTGILANIPVIDRQLLAARGAFEGFSPIVISTDSSKANPDTLTVHEAESRIGRCAREVLYVHDKAVHCYGPYPIVAVTGNMQHFTAKNPRQVVRRIMAMVRRQNGISL